MFRKYLSRAAAALLCASAGSGAFAAAQNNPPRPAPNAPAGDSRADFRDSRLEGRLAYLKSELGITAAQSQAWDVYANAVRDDVRDRFQRRESPPPAARGPASVVDELAEPQQRLAAESARLDRVVAALKPLYAALSDDQHRMADRLLAPDNGPRMAAGMRMPRRFAGDRRFDRRFYR